MKKLKLNIIGLCLLLYTSCEKYLEEPSDRSFAVISKLNDLQALLDHNSMAIAPKAGEASADNYYLTDTDWESLSIEQDQQTYIWASENVFQAGESTNDWSNLYRAVFVANTVLEEIESMEKTDRNASQWNDIKGQALVLRAVSFLDAAQIWSVVYDPLTADREIGIPLRVKSDFNIPSYRADLKETYNQINHDLLSAIPLLPPEGIAKTRASKGAAYGLLARSYLWMGDYANAERYADSCLQINSELMDYNDMNQTVNNPFPSRNIEVVMERRASLGMLMAVGRAKIPQEILDLFDDSDDLRRTLFFREMADESIAFKGFYSSSALIMSGVAVDEMLLTRAECAIRQDEIEQGIDDLNRLLEKRWKTDRYIPIVVTDKQEALDKVLLERRKQLLFRGHRWMDIKRLNREGAGIDLKRRLKGKEYRLTANSSRFALPLPDDLLQYYPD